MFLNTCNIEWDEMNSGAPTTMWNQKKFRCTSFSRSYCVSESVIQHVMVSAWCIWSVIMLSKAFQLALLLSPPLGFASIFQVYKFSRYHCSFSISGVCIDEAWKLSLTGVLFWYIKLLCLCKYANFAKAVGHTNIWPSHYSNMSLGFLCMEWIYFQAVQSNYDFTTINQKPLHRLEDRLDDTL